MDNEKELKNVPTEAELEEKVMQDVSEKIREAAAELEEEIIEAAETPDGEAEEVEEAEPVIVGYDEEGNPIFGEAEPVIVGYDEEGNPIYGEEEVEEEKEPVCVLVKLKNWILSLVGAAVVGAIILLIGMQVPGWVANGGSSAVPATPIFSSGKVVATVKGTPITDKEMEFYIYKAATDYISKNGGVVSDPSEFDWDTEAEDGKTAGQIVKENALKTAVENLLLMEAGKKNKVAWDKDMEAKYVDVQIYQTSKTYGEELVALNALAQGYPDMKTYERMALRNSFGVAIAEDMEKNKDAYYPDVETLKEYAATDGATVKHVLIALEEEAPVPGEEAAAEEAEAPVDKKLLAEEILKKAKDGADFDALVEEFGEDPGQTEAGYTFGPGAMMPEFEKASFALGLNEISDIVETSYGYHIIKRIPGEMDLFNYWRAKNKVKTKDKALEAISVKDICVRVSADQLKFEELYQKYQEENPSTGAGY